MQFPSNEASNNAVLQLLAFANKSLTNTETCYSKVEREALGILHSLEKFHHYGFTYAAGGNLQEKCCRPITQPSKNTI